jgi:hypothetical protein
LEEEEEAIKEHIEFLKEELGEAEDHLASLKKEKE